MANDSDTQMDLESFLEYSYSGNRQLKSKFVDEYFEDIKSDALLIAMTAMRMLLQHEHNRETIRLCVTESDLPNDRLDYLLSRVSRDYSL